MKRKLLVVAHPDDESLFFGGLLLNHKRGTFDLICVTDGGAEKRAKARAAELRKAAKVLGVRDVYSLGFPDIYEQRLDVNVLELVLKDFSAYSEIYTHGILGEYGHPHHQDVSIAVHRCFAKQAPVWSTAFNLYPEKTIALSAKQFQKKSSVIGDIYFKEVERFLGLIPLQAFESFLKLNLSDAEAVYAALLNPLKAVRLKKNPKFAHLAEFIKVSALKKSADALVYSYFEQGAKRKKRLVSEV